MSYSTALDIIDSYLDEPALSRNQIRANRLVEQQEEIDHEIDRLMFEVSKLEEKKAEIMEDLEWLGYSA